MEKALYVIAPDKTTAKIGSPFSTALATAFFDIYEGDYLNEEIIGYQAVLVNAVFAISFPKFCPK